MVVRFRGSLLSALALGWLSTWTGGCWLAAAVTRVEIIERTPFADHLKADEEVTAKLTHEQIDDLFDLEYHTKRVDFIFERVFGA